jgi:DNA polymerase-3 subunit gamma/tau
VAHAYLFCGPRGTGKTSTARILAKAVNCLSPRDGEPDNECRICQAFNEGRALDLIEIDAASNRGIDDIRSLSEKIRFTPGEARYKVYIIDEVHMLTEQAFNALLKTLEEPPAHAIFILATTEAHKVPLTIISRCQRFDFRRIPLERMVDKLAEICRDEGVEASPEALRLMARTSNGGLRDAENLLEQVIVSYGSPITEEKVRGLLGLVGDEKALELAGHVIARAVKEGLTTINQVSSQGDDLRQLHRAATEYLRAILLLKTNAATSLGYPEDVTARLRSLAQAASMEHLVHALKTFARVELRRPDASGSPLPLELAMVESSVLPIPSARVNAQQGVPLGKGDYRGSAPPARGNPGGMPSPRPVPPAAREYPTNYSTPYRNPAPARTPPPPYRSASAGPPASPSAPPDFQRDMPPAELPAEPSARLEAQWGLILRALRNKGRRFKLDALLRGGCRERQVSDGVITLKFSHRSHVERMQEELENPESKKALKDALANAMGSPYEVEVSVVAGDNSGPQQSASQRSHMVRIAQKMGARVVEEKEEEP